MLVALLQPTIATAATDTFPTIARDEATVASLPTGSEYLRRYEQRQAAERAQRVSAQATDVETFFNRWGDPWAERTQPNPDVPVGLTPGCHRAGPKAGRVTPAPEEIAFLATSSSKIVFEECADLRDASNGIGDAPVRAFGQALEQADPSLIFTGYFPSIIASVDVLPGPGPYPPGLQFIDANREDWFVHKADLPPTRANRLKYLGGNPRWDVYDFTRADLRAYLIGQILGSMDFHRMKGIVVDACFDQIPVDTSIPGNVVPPATAAAWQNACVAFLSELNAAAGPDRRVFFLGYLHLGTQGQPSNVNEAAAFQFYQQRVEVTDGLFSEDMFGPQNVVLNAYPFLFDRIDRLMDVADGRGAYLGLFVNTNNQGQSSFGTTSYGQQKAFAQYYLWLYLLLHRGERTPLLHYFPVQSSDQFHAEANFTDWEVYIGTPQGRRTETAAGSRVYRRQFSRGLVYFNADAEGDPVQITPTGGPYFTTGGTQVGSMSLGSRQGIILLTAEGLAGPAPPPPPPVCPDGPRARVSVKTTRVGDGSLRVDITDGSPPFLRLVFGDARNAAINVQNGPSGFTGNRSVTLPANSTSATFFVRRIRTGNTQADAAHVPLTVVDACGDWRTFVGGGPSAW